MTAFRLRVRDNAEGYYHGKDGKLMGWFHARQEAEDVRRHMPNGAQFEVVEVDESTEPCPSTTRTTG